MSSQPTARDAVRGAVIAELLDGEGADDINDLIDAMAAAVLAALGIPADTTLPLTLPAVSGDTRTRAIEVATDALRIVAVRIDNAEAVVDALAAAGLLRAAPTDDVKARAASALRAAAADVFRTPTDDVRAAAATLAMLRQGFTVQTDQHDHGDHGVEHVAIVERWEPGNAGNVRRTWQQSARTDAAAILAVAATLAAGGRLVADEAPDG